VQGDLFKTATDDFWNVLAARNIEKPILIGHSLGGTLAIMLAEQHSDRLRAVVAVDGLPIFPGSERETPQQRAQTAQRMSAMLAAASTPQQFELAEKTYALPYMMRSTTDIAAVAPLTARSDPKASGAWMAEDLMLDLRPALAKASVPLLEIAPYDPTLENSTFASPNIKNAYYASLLSNDTNAKIQIVENSRHFIMYDQPEKLHQALTAFLQALP
jgi:pimeloyl-ACP methyl ester carboxylesterase